MRCSIDCGKKIKILCFVIMSRFGLSRALAIFFFLSHQRTKRLRNETPFHRLIRPKIALVHASIHAQTLYSHRKKKDTETRVVPGQSGVRIPLQKDVQGPCLDGLRGVVHAM